MRKSLATTVVAGAALAVLAVAGCSSGGPPGNGVRGNAAPAATAPVGSVAQQKASWNKECTAVKADFDTMNLNLAGAKTLRSETTIMETASAGLTAAASPGNPSINPGVLTLAGDMHSESQAYAAGHLPTASQFRKFFTDGSTVRGNCPKINFAVYGVSAQQTASWKKECKAAKADFATMDFAPTSITDSQVFATGSQGLYAAATPGNPSANPAVRAMAAYLHSLSQTLTGSQQPSRSQFRTFNADAAAVRAHCPMVSFVLKPSH
jgi:hypothetical protein